MATADSVAVLKHCLVSPQSSTAVTEMSLPLTFLDMGWLQIGRVRRLVFYHVPQISTAYFIKHIIPKLENSLSLTLQHFLPAAGSLIIPSNSNPGMPEIRYRNGDSLALIVAECTTIDFNYFAAKHARNCCDFHPFVPELKPCFDDFSGSVSMSTPVLAFQVTLFPNSGMCVGISNHHALGDANSIFSFMKTWAALYSKILEDDIDGNEVAAALVSESLPFYDRTMTKDTKRLGSIIWDHLRSSRRVENSNFTDSTKSLLTKTDKVSKTFVINRNTTEKLKNLALQKRQNLVHLSSFTVICAYVWICLLKCRGPSGERADEEEIEHFMCLADCRGRMDPPLPANYFGNCLTSCWTKEQTGKLIGEEGFAIAVQIIGEGIHHRLKDKDALFDSSETETKGLNWDIVVTVAGSPRYNYYDLDFGWGKPIQFDFVSSNTVTSPICLTGGRESDGGIEVGLSLPKPKMDAFSTIFNDGLNAL